MADMFKIAQQYKMERALSGGGRHARHHGHELFGAKDFTQEERDRRNTIYVLVVEGGLDVCKQCGAAEIELDQWPTCSAYDAHRREERNKANG